MSTATSTPIYIYRVKRLLERQVVGCTLGRSLLCWREWSCSGSWGSSLLRREWCGTSHRGRGNRRHLAANDVVSADIVEPTALILVSINVELNGDILVHLNVKLLDAVLAKKAEYATPGELSGNFDNIIL